MKILYVCADRGVSLELNNGSAAHVRNMVRAFVHLGHDVELLMSSREGGDDLGVPIHLIPESCVDTALRSAARKGTLQIDGKSFDPRRVASAIGRVMGNVLLEQALNDQVGRYRPDVIYERYSPFCAAGGMVSIPRVLEVNAPLAWQGARYRNQALQEAAIFLEAAAFAGADRIRVISEELRKDLLAANVPPEKIVVVRCGVDTDLFTPNGPVADLGCGKKFVVGFVGSLKPWHGIEYLVDAFRSFALELNAHLLVVGDGPQSDAIETVQREYPDRVSHVRSVSQSDVPAYIRAMDMAVAPYPPLERFYFSPLKVLEYMAVGRTIVASEIGQIPRLIENSRTGLLVPPGDATALAEAARRLRADADLRNRLGEGAAASALEHHSWKQRAAEIIAVMESIRRSDRSGVSAPQRWPEPLGTDVPNRKGVE